PAEVQLGTGRAFLGTPLPTEGAALTTALTWRRRIRVASLLEYRAGGSVLNDTEMMRCARGNCRARNDPTTPLRDQLAWAAWQAGSAAGWIERANFLKLRAVSMTLTAPAAWAQRVGGREMTFTLAGRNLVTWTSYRGLDPDGAQIVYTRRWVNKLEDKWESALWIMNVDGSHNRFLVKGSDARWSPDGTRILYLADGEPKGTQLFVRWMDAEGASSQVTRVTETPADPRWAPDGKAIAFVMLARDGTPWSISLPKPPEGAKWTPAPRVVENLHYRQDRVGYMEQGFTHLFLVPAD